jgi:hypothetical protein
MTQSAPRPTRAFAIRPQPDERSCGPTCLHALYQYFGDDVSLKRVIAETPNLETGGTLAVFLACHALRRGYRASIYTYNLQMFDPTWFAPGVDIGERLAEQRRVKRDARLHAATEGYLEFLGLGGRLRYKELTRQLLRQILTRGLPILTGLSATFLYGTAREVSATDEFDDVRGEPSGHFVVLTDYDRETRQVTVNDPMQDNPVAAGHRYHVHVDRLINAILLGIVTYDANLLVVQPKTGAA